MEYYGQGYVQDVSFQSGGREEGLGVGCKVQGLRHRAEDSIRVQGVGIMVQLLCVC